MYLSPTKRILSIVLVLAIICCFCMIATTQANAQKYPSASFVAIDEDGNRLGQQGLCYDFGEVTAGDLLRLRLTASYNDGYPLDPTRTMFTVSGPDGCTSLFDNTEEDNTYYHTIEIDSTWSNGKYKIQQAQICNTNGDSLIIYSSWFEFTVVGCGVEDNDGPVLESFAISSKNAAPGDSIVISAKAHDEGTTMARNKVSRLPGTLSAVFASGDQTIQATMVYDPEDDTYKASIDLDESIPFGTYTLQTLTMRDRKWNTTVFNPSEEDLNLADYQFTYSDKDTDGPKVLDIQLSAKEVAVGDKLTFTLKATDASGLDLNKSQIVYSNGKKSYLLKFKPTNEPDVYEASVVIPNSYDKGTYYVKTLLVADNEGNNTFASFGNCTFKVVARSNSGYSGGNSVLWFLRNLGYGIAQAAGAGGNDFDTTFSIIDYIISII